MVVSEAGGGAIRSLRVSAWEDEKSSGDGSCVNVVNATELNI